MSINLTAKLLEKINFLNRVNQEFCGVLSKTNNNMFLFHLLKRSSFIVFKTHFSEEFFIGGNQVQILDQHQLKNKFLENKPIEFENFKDFKLICESISLSDFSLVNKFSGNLIKRENK